MKRIRPLILFISLSLLFGMATSAMAITVSEGTRTMQCGVIQYVFIDEDGSLWWRRYKRSESGNTYSQAVFEKVADNVVSCALHDNDSPEDVNLFFIDTNKTLWGLGVNSAGQLGNGTRETAHTPQRILEDVISVDTNGRATYAVRSDHSLWFWGLPSHIYYGEEKPDDLQLTPKKFLDDVASVSTSLNATGAIKTDGSLWTWGIAQYGRALGDGSETDRALPAKVMDGVAAVEMGYTHSMAIKTDQSLWVWGFNLEGQIGDGTLAAHPDYLHRDTPVKVMDSVRVISCSSNNLSLAITGDGKLWGWGSSYLLRTRDSDITSKVTRPVLLAENVADVSAGGAAMLVLKSDGTLWVKQEILFEGFTQNLTGYADKDESTGLYPAWEGVLLPTASFVPKKEVPSAWAVDSVDAAIARGIVPDALQSKYTVATTRAEFCTLSVSLYETITGQKLTERITFSDTTDINVEKMAALGVVSGVGNGNFAPDQVLTREEAATMLARLAKALAHPLPQQAPHFSDAASISSWAYEAVGQMQGIGIMGGVGNNAFAPSESYTREQSIVTMLRLYEYLNR